MSVPEVDSDAAIAVSERLLEAVVGLSVTDAERARVFAGLPPMTARRVSPARRADIMAEIDVVIDQRRFRTIGDGDDQAVWQKGWGEVAEQLRAEGGASLDALKPQYFHSGVELRLLGDYYTPDTDYFEYWLGVAVRRLLMLRAFPNPKRIVELGCGTGMNLIIAAELFPGTALVGTDWVPASLDILKVLAGSLGRDVTGALYDMLSGEGADRLPIDGETDVVTVHALEQLGAAAPGVVDMLVARRPRSVLHIEPILDFYDRADPYDDIAARYHLARGYLRGLAGALDAHAAAGRIEILDKGRVKLGNLYHEAYSYIRWRPA